MVWVRDKTGDFRERPKYSGEELEALCERQMSALLSSRHGDPDRSVSEDDLTVFLEASLGVELDLNAAFSREEGWIQGSTVFRPPLPPLVSISHSLSEDRRYLNRYRTTLGHEAGHVLCLRAAFEREGNVLRTESCCLRYSAEGTAGIHDWKEYQADYCAGALQMRLRVLELRLGARPERSARPVVGSHEARILTARVVEEFGVSLDAARVRLINTGYLRRTAAARQLLLPMPAEDPDDCGLRSREQPELGSLPSVHRTNEGRGGLRAPEPYGVPEEAGRQLPLAFS